MQALKTKIYNHLQALLDERIAIAQDDIDSAKESRDDDTKSSAGDKYETGREMMQAQIDKSKAQLDKNVLLKKELARINLNKANTRVEYGSLVQTDNGIYFIALGLGSVTLGDDTIYVISLVSPVGHLLSGKKVGDSYPFQGKSVQILAIY